MGFDASTAVEPLDYDFTKYVAEAKGTTPEPSDHEIRRFQKAVMSMDKKYRDMTLEQIANQVENLSEEEFEANRTASFDAIEIITKNKPSRAEIEALPHRIKQKYFAYLMRELLNPE